MWADSKLKESLSDVGSPDYLYLGEHDQLPRCRLGVAAETHEPYSMCVSTPIWGANLDVKIIKPAKYNSNSS